MLANKRHAQLICSTYDLGHTIHCIYRGRGGFKGRNVCEPVCILYFQNVCRACGAAWCKSSFIATTPNFHWLSGCQFLKHVKFSLYVPCGGGIALCLPCPQLLPSTSQGGAHNHLSRFCSSQYPCTRKVLKEAHVRGHIANCGFVRITHFHISCRLRCRLASLRYPVFP